MIGKTISYFEILEELGRGGMGIVYQAKDTRLNRIVALKVLPASTIASENAKKRFYREAQAAAKLKNPHIATIYAIEEADIAGSGAGAREAVPLIAMEFIEGGALDDRIEKGPLNIGEAVRIAGQIAMALQSAHEAGVVHRDIKSANVMLDGDGSVKVVDFGLAKLIDSTVLTAENSTVGTFAYMSPEQSRGEDVDHRTDIWSVGVVLYEMICGKRPFLGDYEAAVVYSIGNEEPEPLTSLRTGVPLELERVINRALAKNPADRYQSAEEFRISLRLSFETEGDSTQVSSSQPSVSQKKNSRVGLIAGILGVVAIGLFAILFMRGPANSGPIDSIAVLPLVNASNDPDQDYFADGLTEELIVALGKVPGLNVAARASSFSFRNQDTNIAEAGLRLGVRSILEGSIRKSGEVLRISVHLTEVETGFELWSENYNGHVSDVFAVQEAIATQIMDALRFELGASAAQTFQAATDNVEAYEAYMKGRFFWGKRSAEGLKAAIDFFEHAISLSPNYVQAHVGLADAYCISGFYDFIPPREAFPKARASAEQALRLLPSSAEAHNSLAYVQLYFDWDAERAESSFLKSIELDPRYPVARQWYGNLLTLTGQSQEAHHQMVRAVELDPLAVITTAAIGWSSYYSQNMELAIEELDATFELDPDFALAHLWKGLSYAYMGRMEDALKSLENAVNYSGHAPGIVALQTYALARAGQTDLARAQLHTLEEERETRYITPYDLAKVYFALGDADNGYEHLEQAFNDRSHSMVFLQVDPELSPYSKEDRFQDLVTRVGFNIN